MNRMIAKTLTVAAAACWVTVVGAQSSTMGQAGQEEGRSDKSKKAMKFTGCLQQGDTPNSFKLTDVQPVAGTSGSTSGTSGSMSGSGSGSGTTGSGTSGSGTSGYGMGGSQELELVPSGMKVDLQKHVGQRVEITARPMGGTGDPSGTSGTTGSGTTGSGTTASGQSGMGHGEHGMKGKKVQVTAVRTVGGSCPGGN